MLEKIQVGTEHARMSDETKCESYNPTSKGAVNSCGCHDKPCPGTDIACSAENCKYNSDGCCSAGKVAICSCHTGNCGETECDTFSVK